MQSGIQQPPIRGDMEDQTVMTTTHVEVRWVLTVQDHMSTRARMKFKPKKSRRMVIRNKLTNRFKLHVQGEVILSTVENPIKWFDDSLTDRNNIIRTEKQTEERLWRMEKWKFKALLYQHGLLLRLMWLLTVHKVPMTSIGVESKIKKYLQKWLGITPSFTAVDLYIRSEQLQLLLSSVVEGFKVAECRVVMTHRESQDEQVRHAGLITRSGHNWAADSSVAQAEATPRHRSNMQRKTGAWNFTPSTVEWGRKQREMSLHPRRRRMKDEGQEQWN